MLCMNRVLHLWHTGVNMLLGCTVTFTVMRVVLRLRYEVQALSPLACRRPTDPVLKIWMRSTVPHAVISCLRLSVSVGVRLVSWFLGLRHRMRLMVNPVMTSTGWDCRGERWADSR